uniref:Uncharacterized protein n=1 Tax=Glossina austeni TaxID=7395 RepID=A0A1A9V1F9_GLOAU
MNESKPTNLKTKLNISEGFQVAENPVAKRIFNIAQHTLEFLVILLRIIFELCFALMHVLMSRKLKDVSNEIVLITGNGHGFGRELALGSTVTFVDINEKNNDETVKKAKCLKNASSVYSYTYINYRFV